jgi:hypothetical protein
MFVVGTDLEARDNSGYTAPHYVDSRYRPQKNTSLPYFLFFPFFNFVHFFPSPLVNFQAG